VREARTSGSCDGFLAGEGWSSYGVQKQEELRCNNRGKTKKNLDGLNCTGEGRRSSRFAAGGKREKEQCGDQCCLIKARRGREKIERSGDEISRDAIPAGAYSWEGKGVAL